MWNDGGNVITLSVQLLQWAWEIRGRCSVGAPVFCRGLYFVLDFYRDWLIGRHRARTAHLYHTAQEWGGDILQPICFVKSLIINEMQEFHCENSFHPAWKLPQLSNTLPPTARLYYTSQLVPAFCCSMLGLKSEIRSPIKWDFLWLASFTIPNWDLSCYFW